MCIYGEKKKSFFDEKMHCDVEHIHIEQEREIINDKDEEEGRRRKRRRRTGMLSNCLSRECITTADFVITTLVIEAKEERE
jgi:hypothetical protein